uniref:Ribosomal protein L16 n=1 Tax=Schimmelmannia schousboei TaxID=173468 RepID=A0A0E3DBK8_9FLOR|nr:ribosomal protein L16 [Schimmelmannia schousboei]
MNIQKKTHNKYKLKHNYTRHILKFGKYGIKINSFSFLSEKQIVAIEWALLKKIKKVLNNKTFKFWNLICCNLTLTKLSLESRMGKGKGAIYEKAIFLKRGVILFEIDKVSRSQMLDIFYFIKKRIPARVILVSRVN